MISKSKFVDASGSALEPMWPALLVVLAVAMFMASCDHGSEGTPATHTLTSEQAAQSIRQLREALADAKDAQAIALADGLLTSKESLSPDQQAEVERLNAMLVRARGSASGH